MDYIPGMRDSLYIKNPLKHSRILPCTTEFFYNSKWLVEKKSNLVKKFYSRRIRRNKFIVYLATIISGLIGLSSSLYGVYLLNENFKLNSSNAQMLGINVALITIACGFYVYMKMEDIFPLNSWAININNRKRK